jgi:hypothetical protein
MRDYGPGKLQVPGFAVKYASAGGEPAEAFAKGGDSEEHLGGVLFRLHFYDSAQILLCISSNVIGYM